MKEHINELKLIIFSPFYPPSIGGLQNHAEEFNKYLSPHVAKITVFTSRIPRYAPEKECIRENIEIVRFPAFEIIPNYPLPQFWNSRFWKLILSLKKDKNTIVISRMRFFSTSLLAMLYSKLKRIKWVHIEHGSDFVKLNNRLHSILAKIIDLTIGRMVLILSDANVANSYATSAFIERLIKKRRRNHIIYRGVEKERIRNIDPDWNLRNKYSDDFLILYVGRLIDGKGIISLIKAVEKINARKVKCLIVGDGPQKKNLEEYVSKIGLDGQIIFLGEKKHDEAISIMKTCDVIINPSYTEGLPTTIIEAALCQKAIIATKVGGTPEIITDKISGFLIEPGNINELAEKMLMFINDKTLSQRLSKNAQSEASRFDWSKSIEDYIDLFLKILHGE